MARGHDDDQPVGPDRPSSEIRRGVRTLDETDICTAPPRTRRATSVELTAVRDTVVSGCSLAKTASQAGSRYSATVRLEATRSRASRCSRRAATPASSVSAAVTTARAQSATSAPAGVKVEPWRERWTSDKPTSRSIPCTRPVTAGWLIRCSRAAAPRLPELAMVNSSSSAFRSGTRDESMVDTLSSPLDLVYRRSQSAEELPPNSLTKRKELHLSRRSSPATWVSQLSLGSGEAPRQPLTRELRCRSHEKN